MSEHSAREQQHLRVYCVETAWDLVLGMEQAGLEGEMVQRARKLAADVELEARLNGVAVETNASRIVKRGTAGGRDVKPGNCP